jgi:hypothetical protein
MTTQKFMGKNQLIDRLAAQVGNRDTAIGILQKRGHLKADGKTLTAEGKKRDSMTAEERAIDRATKRTGETAKNFKYDPKTNRATFRKK